MSWSRARSICRAWRTALGRGDLGSGRPRADSGGGGSGAGRDGGGGGERRADPRGGGPSRHRPELGFRAGAERAEGEPACSRRQRSKGGAGPSGAADAARDARARPAGDASPIRRRAGPSSIVSATSMSEPEPRRCAGSASISTIRWPASARGRGADGADHRARDELERSGPGGRDAAQLRPARAAAPGGHIRPPRRPATTRPGPASPASAPSSPTGSPTPRPSAPRRWRSRYRPLELSRAAFEGRFEDRSGVAQFVEHSAVNRVVVGSSPTPGAFLGPIRCGPVKVGSRRSWRLPQPAGPRSRRRRCRPPMRRSASARAR